MAFGSYLNLNDGFMSSLQGLLSTSIHSSDIIIDNDTGSSSDASLLGPHQYPLGLSAAQIRFLKDKPEAVKRICRKLFAEGFECKFDLQEGSLRVKTLGDQEENQAVRIVKETIVEREMLIEIPAFSPMLSDTYMPPNSRGGIGVLVVIDGNTLKFVGMADEIEIVGWSLSKTSQNTMNPQNYDTVTKEEIIQVSENDFAFIQEFQLEVLTDKVASKTGSVLSAGNKKLHIKGESSAVADASKIVQEMIDGLKTTDVNLSPEIDLLKLTEVTSAVGKKHKCSITFHLKEESRKSPLMQSTKVQQEMLSLSLIERRRTTIKVVMNAIERQQADVIVNTTNSELVLDTGRGVSWCILQAAGGSIQEELKEKYPVGIENGDIAESGPGNLKTCKMIFHGSLPTFPTEGTSTDYEQEKQKCFKWMVSLVFNCLIKASAKGFKTIALPALGTGALDYPVQHVVQLLYRAVRLYNEDRRSGPIKEVILVIYPDTKLEVKQLFLSHRQTHRLKTRHVATIHQFQEENTQERQGKCEIRVKLGETLLQVVHGSIKEACDVTESILVQWSAQNIRDPGSNPGLTCIDPSRRDWKCDIVSTLPANKCVVDDKTLPKKTLIHSYSREQTDLATVQVIVQGLEAATRVANTITIPLAFEGPMAKKPISAARVIVDAVKEADEKIHVVTVAVEKESVFLPFVNEVAALFNNRLHPPADIDKSSIAVDLWEKTFANKAADSSSALSKQSMKTGVETVLRITCDSQVRINKALRDLKDKLDTRSYTAC